MNIRKDIRWNAFFFPVALFTTAIVWIYTDFTNTVVAFNITLYTWFTIRFLVVFIYAVQLDDAQDFQAKLFNSDNPALALTTIAVAGGSALLVWYTGLIPVLPTPNTAWTLSQILLAVSVFALWMPLTTFVFLVSVAGVGDLIRRGTGKEPLHWH